MFDLAEPMTEKNVVTIPIAMSGSDDDDNLKLTTKAIAEVKKIKGQNSIPEHYGLRMGVKGGGCSGFTYTLGFDAEPRDTDKILEAEDIRVFVDPKSLFYLMGVELDFTDGLNGRGFTFNNPNATKTCGCGSSFGV
jgi:iron-sulfur cluster assembly protein